ncbi:MAG: methionine--tRNA ligase [Patescibacteria group bacterium]|jgi:methionyl-tRNA synthetase
MAQRFYITTPIYYVNDKPHIGHAYTTIAADVLARYWRKEIGAENVFFLTGTDEHAQKNVDSAKEHGMETQEFIDLNAANFQKAFAALNISNDIFMRTTAPFHKKSVDVFMQKLYDAGALYEGSYEGLYCKGCEDFYTEKDLQDGLCPIHGTKPEVLKEKNWFFKLTAYLDKVEQAITDGTLQVGPDSRRNETLGLIKELRKIGSKADFSVTRERATWGVDFVVDPSQKVYVWVEALQNYISALGYPDGERFKKFWPADVQLMAKDIIKFHAVHWPAMLLAAGVPLPKKVFAHGFFSLNGKKMSKSLGNVIDPLAMVEQYGADATRYLLLSQFPFGNDGDIQEERFAEKYNADLANGLGNLVSRTTNMIAQYCNGEVERRVPSGNLQKSIGACMERIALDEALLAIWSAIAEANGIIDVEKPWVLAKEGSDEAKKKIADVLADLRARVEEIGASVTPFMPEKGEKIVAAVTAEKIEKAEPLFPRMKL